MFLVWSLKMLFFQQFQTWFFNTYLHQEWTVFTWVAFSLLSQKGANYLTQDWLGLQWGARHSWVVCHSSGYVQTTTLHHRIKRGSSEMKSVVPVFFELACDLQWWVVLWKSDRTVPTLRVCQPGESRNKKSERPTGSRNVWKTQQNMFNMLLELLQPNEMKSKSNWLCSEKQISVSTPHIIICLCHFSLSLSLSLQIVRNFSIIWQLFLSSQVRFSS